MTIINEVMEELSNTKNIKILSQEEVDSMLRDYPDSENLSPSSKELYDRLMEDLSEEENTENLKCDLCGSNFHYFDIYHFSGILNGEISNHIHVCKDCVLHYDLNIEFDFDNILDTKEI